MNLLLVGSWDYNQVHHLAVKFNILILTIYQIIGGMDHRVNCE